MWKLFVLIFLVGQELHGIGAQKKLTDTSINLTSAVWPAQKKNGEGSSETLSPSFPGGQYNFHAANIIFNVHGRPSEKFSVELTNGLSQVANGTRSDYRVIPGIGALKVHARHLPWSKARRTCVEEGGHLAVIRSNFEQTSVVQMMTENSIEDAWVGLHDKFEEGDWVTVTDEPLASTGWAKWSKIFPNNPDNYKGSQHCARIVKNADGMDDDNCDIAKPFLCKISNP
ncbi:hemolymph lipopolysaccharide-binding protein-like [Venturia canescens]|uniref:hemolymph lipopolysaccharide-binding protein-like n=1 Tax=Venturia canescens TaxID=32260 RepID=UPI001C9D5DA6|nr:hemolymph lipopolysaccharide-binding protein-like [Venturia canescens]